MERSLEKKSRSGWLKMKALQKPCDAAGLQCLVIRSSLASPRIRISVLSQKKFSRRFIPYSSSIYL
jgi:hypothetical protein